MQTKKHPLTGAALTEFAAYCLEEFEVKSEQPTRGDLFLAETITTGDRSRTALFINARGYVDIYFDGAFHSEGSARFVAIYNGYFRPLEKSRTAAADRDTAQTIERGGNSSPFIYC